MQNQLSILCLYYTVNNYQGNLNLHFIYDFSTKAKACLVQAAVHLNSGGIYKTIYGKQVDVGS